MLLVIGSVLLFAVLYFTVQEFREHRDVPPSDDEPQVWRGWHDS